MAEFSYPWGVDATDAAAADSRLYQVGWREILSSAIADCVVWDRSGATPANGPLYVSAPGTGTVISIAAGSAVVQGFLYDNTTTKTIDVATVGVQPSTGQSRTDSVVLRLSPTASPASTRLSVQLLAGTPATTGSQVAPTLTKNTTGTWEVEIARVTRASGANVLQANITQLHPRPITPVRSTNAPGSPTMGQQWIEANGNVWIWNGTLWKYNGGGPIPTVRGVPPTSSPTATSTGASLQGSFTMDTATNPSVVSTRGWASRFYAETPGTFRMRAVFQPRFLAAAASANQLSVALQARLNSAGSFTGGTLITQTFLTINPGIVAASAYGLIEIDDIVTLNAGDYVEYWTNWTNSNSTNASASAQLVGASSVASLTWVGA